VILAFAWCMSYWVVFTSCPDDLKGSFVPFETKVPEGGSRIVPGVYYPFIVNYARENTGSEG
jgi:hypothetical protein